MLVRSTVDSPFGPLTVYADEVGLRALYFTAHKGAPSHEAQSDHGHPLFARLGEQLRDYFAGRRRDFDLPLHPRGSEFQQRVWTELQSIAYGATTTYGRMAEKLGVGLGAARAVGAAVGRNPLSILIPCHRVVGSTGKLTGFAGGLQVKSQLLLLESGQAALF